jgi:hypothetical protein
MSIGKTNLILKCTVACRVRLDGVFITSLKENEVKSICIDSGEHLLELENHSRFVTNTKVIHAPAGGNLVIFDDELKDMRVELDDSYSLLR